MIALSSTWAMAQTAAPKSSTAAAPKLRVWKMVSSDSGTYLLTRITGLELGFGKGVNFPYSQMVQKALGVKVNLHGDDYKVECCPAATANLLFRIYDWDSSRGKLNLQVVAVSESEYYQLQIAKPADNPAVATRWLEHSTKETKIGYDGNHTMWDPKQEFIFVLRRAR